MKWTEYDDAASLILAVVAAAELAQKQGKHFSLLDALAHAFGPGREQCLRIARKVQP